MNNIFFQTMTAAEYREFMGLSPKVIVSKSDSKYHAKKTEVDGIKFDSKHESRDYLKLKSMEESGIIYNLQRQVRFEILPAYQLKDGTKIRAINYVADFVYERDGTTYVQDSKGVRTDVYKIKKKMFQYRYPDIVFIES